VINNYKLTDEDLKNSEEVEEDHLEDEEDEAEQYMSIAELKSKMKKKSDNIKNKPMNKLNVNSTRENSGHSRSSSKINKKMGRQVATINSSGLATVLADVIAGEVTTITATSVEDPTEKGTSTLTIV